MENNKIINIKDLQNNYNFPKYVPPEEIQVSGINKKRKLLCWSDCVFCSTGFATVARHILHALYETGLWDIDQLAINFTGDFYDKEQFPYTIIPARLKNPQDPYGSQMFLDAIGKKDYDAILIINDLFVVNKLAEYIQKIKDLKASKNYKPFSVVYYFPVDHSTLNLNHDIIKTADIAVPYTYYAKEKCIEQNLPVIEPIYHGADIKNFHPISQDERRTCRQKYLGVQDDNTFVFVTVARNSPRKDIAKSILAFSEFRKRVTNNCVYYIHAKMLDTPSGGLPLDLRVPIMELGLDIRKDIIFPGDKFDPGIGFPIQYVNQLMNCGDIILNTTLAEGFGLNFLESMACGIPSIVPIHTSIPEIFGYQLSKEEQRGYFYLCKEKVIIDNGGYKDMAHLDDILNQMEIAYNDWRFKTNRRRRIIKNILQYAHQYSWDNVCKEWVTLFNNLKPEHKNTSLSGENL